MPRRLSSGTLSHACSRSRLHRAAAHSLSLHSALKTRGSTPKYGLIFHSTFIGRASAKNKGRISRYLANKCSIASRLDSFLDTPTNLYGEKLRDQVEERLTFYDTGHTPRKNAEVMAEAKALVDASHEDSTLQSIASCPPSLHSHLLARSLRAEPKKKKKSKEDKKKKRKAAEADEDAEEDAVAVEETPKKDKKKKKRSRDEDDDGESRGKRVKHS